MKNIKRYIFDKIDNDCDCDLLEDSEGYLVYYDEIEEINEENKKMISLIDGLTKIVDKDREALEEIKRLINKIEPITIHLITKIINNRLKDEEK
jgi:hypothetical protein